MRVLFVSIAVLCSAVVVQAADKAAASKELKPVESRQKGALVGSFDDFKTSFVVGQAEEITVPRGDKSLGGAINDGLTLVHTFGDGLRLFARMKDRQVVEWVATDRNGRRLRPVKLKLDRHEVREKVCYRIDESDKVDCYRH